MSYAHDAEIAALRARVADLEARLASRRYREAAEERAALHYEDPDAALRWEEAQEADRPGRAAMERFNAAGEPW